MLDANVEELLEEFQLVKIEGQAPSGRELDPAAVTKAVELGLIASAGGLVASLRGVDRYQLTSAGEAQARDVIRRHRLSECMLKSVLGVKADRVDTGACKFEHVLTQGLDDNVCALLGHPSKCPHGRPIPPGPCCLAAGQDTFSDVGPLSAGKKGGHGVVAYLSTREQRQVQKLMAMGILPGVPIKLLRRFPSFVFQVEYSQFTVDEELAASIFVHWSDAAKTGKSKRH